MMRVELIPAVETLPLRQKVLRPGQALSDCLLPEDHDPLTFHLGVFESNELISIATFMVQSHPELHGGFPYRLRGMATEEKWRAQGYAGILVRRGLEILKDRRCDLLWFNARERAFGFYTSLGFLFHGPLFEMPGIGPHKVMYKHLIPR